MSKTVVYSHFNLLGEALIKHFNALPYMDKKDVGIGVNNRTVYIYIADHRQDLIKQFTNICTDIKPNIKEA
jgi:hypothetical protein